MLYNHPSKDNNLINILELKLTNLAYKVRSARQTGNFDAMETFAADYQATLDDLWRLGWDGIGLLSESELYFDTSQSFFQQY